MKDKTAIQPQTEAWLGSFGREYTERNAQTVEEMDVLYRRNLGLTRTEINRRFLDPLSCSLRVLEVGANIGTQLLCLERMGFGRLAGVELQRDAIRRSRNMHRVLQLLQASAYEIPFPDGAFDLVFTSGLLIHIPPAMLDRVMGEIHRCTRQYIWGREYFAPETTEVVYRERLDLLWKSDYAKLYLTLFQDLELVREERLKYTQDDNVDTFFLLRKVYPS
jgi:pseudaminic acid biosynthesis-associated methylase